MACNCGKNNSTPTASGKTGPLDQCLGCAYKHIAEANSAWREYTYAARNRLWVVGQLRSAVSHTYERWPAIATAARDLAHAIMLQQADKIPALWDTVIDIICDAYKGGN